VVGAETRREADGLALSSRNRYLEPEQRVQAGALSRALRAAQQGAEAGAQEALVLARAELLDVPGVDVDYLVVTGTDLKPLPDVVPAGTEARVLVAARVGPTRLIDNMPVIIGVPGR
jgi:pantoate--beta-alanine ligase